MPPGGRPPYPGGPGGPGGPRRPGDGPVDRLGQRPAPRGGGYGGGEGGGPFGPGGRFDGAFDDAMDRFRDLDKKTWAIRIGKVAAIGILVMALIGSGAAIFAYNTIAIPSENAAFMENSSDVYFAGGKQELGRFQGDQNRQSLTWAQIPEVVKQTVVSAEDRTFWTNNGVDLRGIARTLFTNATEGTAGGASTITQQYVKNLYLTQEHSYSRKVKEAVISLKLSRQKSKEDILAGYLNTIYFNRGAYGIQAAAKAYFRKDAKDLTLQQAAALSAILNNPSGFDPASSSYRGDAALLGRYQYVIDGMVKLGYLDAAKADEYKKALPHFPKEAADSRLGDQKGHALTLVKAELLNTTKTDGSKFTEQEINGGGLHITTTLNPQVMKTSENAVKAQLREMHRKDTDPKDEVHQKNALHGASATVDVKTGALLGFYGGQDYLESQINWAAHDNGGPAGSTMKAFATAAALESGFSLKDTFNGNSPFKTYDNRTVQNESDQQGVGNGHDYGRHITLLHALEQSVNTAFIDLTQAMSGYAQKGDVDNKAGRKAIYKLAIEAGLTPSSTGSAATKADYNSGNYPGMPATTTSLDDQDDQIALGKEQVSPINMANAYATIADGGYRHDVHVVTEVTDSSGKVLYKANPQDGAKHAIDEDVASDVSYGLQDVVKKGTGKAALELGRPVAGKTGTGTCGNDNYVCSSWFVGYTPQVATAVKFSRGDGTGHIDEGFMDSYFGADHPTHTWLSIMQKVMKNKPVEDFPPPAWVDGKAPTAGHDPSLTASPKPSPSASPTPSDHCTKRQQRKGLCIPMAPSNNPSPGVPGVPGQSPGVPGSTQTTNPGGQQTNTCTGFFCGNNGNTSTPTSTPTGGATSTGPGNGNGGGAGG